MNPQIPSQVAIDSQQRLDYHHQTPLDEKNLPNQPYLLFNNWYTQAKQANILEPYAMHLSTVEFIENTYKPHSRIVLMRGFSEQGLIFYTNYDSAKGQHIEQNSNVSATFFWQAHERQVRIEGKAQKLSDAENDTYFYSRPEGSQISAIASPQSQIIDKATLLEKQQDLQQQAKQGKPIIRPKHWGGYCIEIDYIEFWQGASARLHDRIVYCKIAPKNQQANRLEFLDGWYRYRLAP